MQGTATHHFMAADFTGILAAFCVFAFVTLIPGYAFGWLLDLMRFRARTIACRILLSVAVSIALGPEMIYFVRRWLSMASVWAVYGVLSVCTVFLFVRGLRNAGAPLARPSRTHCLVLATVGAWIVIALASLTDLQIGRRLYFSSISYDYAVRVPFTEAINVFGIPARNPFFFPGHPVALRYHYFWLMLPALVHGISWNFVDARQALIAGTIWCGIALMCVIALYLRFFSNGEAADIAKRALVGILLLGVTGLDLLPTLFLLWVRRQGADIPVAPSVEWWNNQVDGLLYTTLWEPHAICSLVACLTGFLLIWDVARHRSPTRCMIVAIVAGCCFATAVGACIYVALAFAIFLLFWTMVTVWNKWYLESLSLTLSGIIACALSVPFLVSLRGRGSGGAFLQLGFKEFFFIQIFLKALGLTHAWRTFADVVFLPVSYFLELGLFGVVGWIVWKGVRAKKRPFMRPEMAGFAMISTSIVVCTFLRTGVIQNNDLGWLGFLIAQFILLIWAADLFMKLSVRSRVQANATGDGTIGRGRRDLLIAFLMIGALGVVYDLTMLRFFPLLSDAGVVPKLLWLAKDEKLGIRTYANREAYEWLRARTPVQAILQQNPQVDVQDSFYGLYANRQTVAENISCGTVFGGDPQQCRPISTRLIALFSAGDNSSSQSFVLACRSLPVDFFVAKDTDGAWKDQHSWVWTRTPIFANGFVRLFPCPDRSGG